MRKQILEYTPIGTPAEEVAEFILSRLYYEGSYVSGIGVTLRPSVTVTLGSRPGNSVGHSAVKAEWIGSDLRGSSYFSAAWNP